jgi:hypothetical protein
LEKGEGKKIYIEIVFVHMNGRRKGNEEGREYEKTQKRDKRNTEKTKLHAHMNTQKKQDKRTSLGLSTLTYHP